MPEVQAYPGAQDAGPKLVGIEIAWTRIALKARVKRVRRNFMLVFEGRLRLLLVFNFELVICCGYGPAPANWDS